MQIRIKIENKIVKTTLLKGSKVFDVSTFAEANNLSEKLLPAIDEILKKNKISSKDIKKVSVETDTPESFTTSRIAQAVGKSWNWGISTLRITNLYESTKSN
jgi:tRNA A37 threonylcarbamoyladenosine modification protein TsaB